MSEFESEYEYQDSDISMRDSSDTPMRDYSSISGSAQSISGSEQLRNDPGPSNPRRRDLEMDMSDSEKSTSTTSTAERPLHEKESADDLSERIAQAKPDLARWYSGWEESHPATWCREPNPIYGAEVRGIRSHVKAQLLVDFPRKICLNENVPADDGCLVRVYPKPDPAIYGEAVFIQVRVYPAEEDTAQRETPRVPDHTIQPIRFERKGLVCATYDRKTFEEDPHAVYFLLDQLVFPKEGKFRYDIDVGIEDTNELEPMGLSWVKKNRWLGQLKVTGKFEVIANYKGKVKEKNRSTDQIMLIEKILARPLMNADDEIIPRELEKNKHVRPERVPDPRIWKTKDEAKSDSTETPAVPADWTLDPPAVRELWESRLKKMENMTGSQRQQVLQDIAKQALKVMYPGVVPSGKGTEGDGSD